MTTTTEHDAAFLGKVLEAIEKDVVPKTMEAVKVGNKVFGACILRKDSLDTVVADTNREMEWPLLHGEVSTLRSLQCIKVRPANKDCVFVSTHEPCSLCLSAITWSGFTNFYYLFSYTDTKDTFNIPHDLKILQEVFNCPNGSYTRSNAYWSSYSIAELIDALEDDQQKIALRQKVTDLQARYNDMSAVYQASKADTNAIPLS
mmetsp:Transcript_27098/g.87580  ORF Transcript_27098/g.87580 Transcript_27098/m.87580 type:complete len:203 (-) Transcript_27098:32-640(-)